MKAEVPTAWSGRILRGVLLGLDFMHSNGVVHGDLHPSNTLAVKCLDATPETTAKTQQQPSQAPRLQQLDGLRLTSMPQRRSCGRL